MATDPRADAATLDVAKLRQLAEAARDDYGPPECRVTECRVHAQPPAALYQVAASPVAILALLDRLESAERLARAADELEAAREREGIRPWSVMAEGGRLLEAEHDAALAQWRSAGGGGQGEG